MPGNPGYFKHWSWLRGQPMLDRDHICLPYSSHRAVFLLSLPPSRGLLVAFQQNVCLQMSSGTLSVHQVYIHHLSHLLD